MTNLIAKKYLFFSISTAVIIPGIVFLALYGLKFGIDFAGGTLWELKFEKPANPATISQILAEQNSSAVSVQPSSEGVFLVRLKTIDKDTATKLKQSLEKNLGKVEELRFETVGPTVSAELTRNAVKAVGLALVAILAYVAWAFRQVPKPASSLRFAIATLLALLHDVLVVIGSFAILGKFFGAEIDSLFVTALLTVIGFSVHDTIVVFDRIRENLGRSPQAEFSAVVNLSLVQTLGRSLSTSLTVVFVLTALLLFGGSSIRWFVIALLIGIVSGTYSSIFNAAPILVVWNEKFAKKTN